MNVLPGILDPHVKKNAQMAPMEKNVLMNVFVRITVHVIILMEIARVRLDGRVRCAVILVQVVLMVNCVLKYAPATMERRVTPSVVNASVIRDTLESTASKNVLLEHGEKTVLRNVTARMMDSAR